MFDGHHRLSLSLRIMLIYNPLNRIVDLYLLIICIKFTRKHKSSLLHLLIHHAHICEKLAVNCHIKFYIYLTHLNPSLELNLLNNLILKLN